jgi:radical SAM superfamily enzyme YgiQ (UPF0313 family)
MAFDILFIASDSEGAAFFHPERHEYLQTKYGLKAEEVRQLVFASAPAWVQDGVPMSYTAAENWFRNGRRFSLTQAEIDQYLDDQSRENLTRFGNGIYVSDHLLRQGLSVRLINDLGPEWQKFLRNAAEGPRVVAISTTFLESRERTEACARRVREVLPDVPIVIGGPLVHYSHKILHEAPHLASHAQTQITYFFMGPDADPAVDAVIIDTRGEATLAELARRVKNGLPWKDLANVAYPDENRKWVFNPCIPEHVEVDDEGVAWDKLPDEFLGREIGIRGSRGCPLRCKFCSFVVIHPEFEVKQVDVLRDELRLVAGRHEIVKHVSFVDDNLFLTRKSVFEYTQMMVQEKFPFSWSGFIRVDSITPENAQLMKESGCNFVMLGIESGDVEMLQAMRKVQRPEKVLRAVNLLADVGISSLSTLVVGFPGETEETIAHTIELLNAYPDKGPTTHWFNCWVHTVIPLTPVDKERETWDLSGILLDWKHATMDVGGAFHQRERLLREVRHGGAYNGPYAMDSHEPFAKRGDAGFDDMRRFYKLRHRIGCLDYFGLTELDGCTREQTLDEIEEIILRTATAGANGWTTGAAQPTWETVRMREG